MIQISTLSSIEWNLLKKTRIVDLKKWVTLDINTAERGRRSTWSHSPLRRASAAFKAMAMAFISGFLSKLMPWSLGISTYFSRVWLNWPERFPFQTNVTWPNFTVSLQTKQHIGQKKTIWNIAPTKAITKPTLRWNSSLLSSSMQHNSSWFNL